MIERELIKSYAIDPADLPEESVLFGGSAVMQEVHGQIQRILHNDLPVLICGEKGTGKELIARFLHSRSDRCQLPFVRVDCTAMHERMWEDGFFGPNGEVRQSEGENFRALAGSGTVFFDEIGDLRWDLQAKLLDLLQDQADARTEKMQARIVCSTHRDLEKAVERRAFRRDLFYRIDVINLRVAPLRERREDIPRWCEYFLARLARRFDRQRPELTAGALERLKRWNWPGNLRELETKLSRLFAAGSRGGAIEKELDGQAGTARVPGAALNRLADARRAARRTQPKRSRLLRALKANQWNRRKAAEELNMSYRSFLARMRQASVPRRQESERTLPPERLPGLD